MDLKPTKRHYKRNNSLEFKNLPPIPEKRYFSISEVSQLCFVEPYVLRYWEQEFRELAPIKRKGNRRFYQHSDVLLIRKIRNLLYEEGYTIEGARLQLKPTLKTISQPLKLRSALKKLIAELETVLQNLRSTDRNHIKQ